MAWKGFLTESKSYMGYPDFHHEADFHVWKSKAPERRRKKIKFWLAFPIAAVKFYYLTFCDWFLCAPKGKK